MKTPGASSQLRPGMKTLLDVLNGREFSVPSDAEWEAALTLAEQERILAWFVSRLRSSAIAFTPALEARLTIMQRESTIAAFLWCGELKGLLRSFHAEGIPAIPLKGPALAERIYGGTSLRTNSDLDILVRKSDFSQAQVLLERLGFAAKEFDRYHQPWLRGTTMVELHDDVVDPRWFDFHIPTAWKFAEPTEFQGVPTFRLSDEDEFLFLAIHGVRHEFDRLTFVLDLVLAVKKLEHAALNFRPEVAPLQGQLLLGYMLARRLLPEVCPILSLPGGERQNGDLETLAAQLETRILTDQVAPLHWRQRNRFHRRLELSGREKFNRLRQQLAYRSGEILGASERDRRFGAQFGLSRTWQLILIRPFRVLLKALGRSDE
jgi:hypothetical protein